MNINTIDKKTKFYIKIYHYICDYIYLRFLSHDYPNNASQENGLNFPISVYFDLWFRFPPTLQLFFAFLAKYFRYYTFMITEFFMVSIFIIKPSPSLIFKVFKSAVNKQFKRIGICSFGKAFYCWNRVNSVKIFR